MNGLVKEKIKGIMLGLLLISLFVFSGCKPKDKQPVSETAAPGESQKVVAQPQFKVELDGTLILKDVLEKYSSAKSYQDKAVLYLSYQLQGRNIQEPQRWSTYWDITGRMAAQLFNGEIHCDGEILSCYIYDIETANLDSQHLLMPYDRQLPINQLFRDSIVKHFLGGYSELPLDESDLLAPPKLIPPTISLLTNQVRNGWLQNPSGVERLPDERVDEQDCFVVRTQFQGMTSDVWVNQATNALVKISLPLKLLAGEVITSPEITDVVLMAKFHEPVFDEAIPDEEFKITPRSDSLPVLKYVSLPESFPSDLIGQPTPKFNLIKPDRTPADTDSFGDKVTALLWLAGPSSYQALLKFDNLAKTMSTEEFNFAAVYSDSELKSPGSGSIETVDELAAVTGQIRIPTFYDPGLAASSALQIKAIPSVILLGSDSKVQFARALSDDNWLAEVKAAAERVANGDDVATEMQTEYQRFLDSYRQQLLTVSAAGMIEIPNQKTLAAQASAVLQPSSTNQLRSNVRLRPEKSWGNSEFKKAGNIAVLPVGESAEAYLIFDGWRTVVELSAAGKTLSRVELKLPAEAAANLIRIGKNVDDKNVYAVFSARGEKVYLFNAAWSPIGVYPNDDTKHKGILDCQLTDLNDDGTSELVVSFDDQNGVHLVNTATQVGEKISGTIASSVAEHEGDVVVTGQGKIGMLKTGLTNVEETELEFRRVASLGKDLICGLGSTSSGQWNAVGFDSELKRAWTLSVGSQFFESEIEPIAVAKASTGEFIWAIADTQDAIHLVSGGGKWLGDFQSESQLGGIALVGNGSDVRLLVANESGIECWDLNLNSSPMRPVSSQR